MTLEPGLDRWDPARHDLAQTLRNLAVQAKVFLLHDGMLEELAPAVEGPIVSTGRGRRGRLVFGDAVD